MFKGAIFTSNRNQAVRLPKAASLPDNIKRVEIVAIGNTRIISPEGESWSSWFDGPTVTDDFMSDREQPKMQERDSF
ncbi:type II toxin-antitoxin system VapB family antitoxin [Pseudovibrio sp. Tun.PSC04-5.I4]|uniref:type II toxin-antitoxin system VapB family antitoxin n=1 Tax=Pseudovibrio sp. Tun.PSC04-5.I4 TaxID=1798213 RepID=UPI00088877B8|nr:type II toxin-antitoxin system VapB family antitoxin [Pseudovibrio sp. Tun.PSC04-5.I4]SDQ13725.1 antitoxin VapB [Pseudovibrio sp. Tun.PSC04-5.I4]